ncbi:MAG: tripartite tricarboxylate transporter substrate binding protein [Betaproteobacteria bacterium]|nr:tripartite tricarboxylate transporter substrate binding protein [Betaproteobacteria bacterium]
MDLPGVCRNPGCADGAHRTLILPYAPGGSTSTLAYLIRQKLTDSWGQQIVVLHRPGGSATIGAAAAAKAPADGYTLILVTATHVISPLLLPVSYDAIKDFAPVTPVSNVEVMLVVHPSVPAKNLKEFVALAKTRPGQLNYATSSAGSPAHLAAELFSMRVGIKMQAIAYKGGNPAVTDLLGGQVEALFGNPINVAHHINAGRLRALAVSGEHRLPALKQVPTFGEGGLANFDVGFWQGILAPAGTPRPVVDKLAGEIGRIMLMPDIKEKLASLGVEPYVASPEAFAARMRADTEKYADVIGKRNIKKAD